MKTTKLEIVSKLATILASIVAICSLTFGLFSYLRNSEFQKQVMTNQIFTDYSKLCLQYPEYASGLDTTLSKDPKELDKYYSFADYALYSGETILALNKTDSAWIGTVQSIIETHEDYILSGEFPWNNYSLEMEMLIKKTLVKLQKK
jgi:hypothetical protein